jgi:hypothetical protein
MHFAILRIVEPAGGSTVPVWRHAPLVSWHLALNLKQRKYDILNFTLPTKSLFF